MAARIDFIELPTGASDAAADFYRKAFGWDFTDFGPTYACTMTGDVDLGLQVDPAEKCSSPLPVIRVDDLDQAAAAVEAAGGVVNRPIFAYPGGRRFHFRDVDGNEMAAHRPSD